MQVKKNINKKVSLIAYLLANGVSIPHYCHYNDLSIAGNCRVCLIELKNSMKPIVSCVTNANAALYNNSVYHDSALIKKARENILKHNRSYSTTRKLPAGEFTFEGFAVLQTATWGLGRFHTQP